jgi:hypothetical protein
VFHKVASGARLVLPCGVVAAMRGPALGADASTFRLTVELSYYGDDESERWSDDVTLVFAADGTARASFPVAGEYGVARAFLTHVLTGMEYDIDTDSNDEALAVTVRADAAETTIALPAGALHDALRRAKQN